jgi:hypothetical protein
MLNVCFESILACEIVFPQSVAMLHGAYHYLQAAGYSFALARA